MAVKGRICAVGEQVDKLFFYAVGSEILIEVLKKRRSIATKHLVRLVDGEGHPVRVPPDCRFEHVSSGEDTDLLDIHLHAHERQARQAVEA